QAIRLTSKRPFTTLQKPRYNWFPCWLTWEHGDEGTPRYPGNYPSARSFLKRVGHECGKPSWQSYEVFILAGLRRDDPYSLNSRRHSTLLSGGELGGLHS